MDHRAFGWCFQPDNNPMNFGWLLNGYWLTNIEAENSRVCIVLSHYTNLEYTSYITGHVPLLISESECRPLFG